MSAASSPPWSRARRTSSRRSTRRWRRSSTPTCATRRSNSISTTRSSISRIGPTMSSCFWRAATHPGRHRRAVDRRPAGDKARARSRARARRQPAGSRSTTASPRPIPTSSPSATRSRSSMSSRASRPHPLAGPANRQARIAADNMLATDPAARKHYGGTMARPSSRRSTSPPPAPASMKRRPRRSKFPTVRSSFMPARTRPTIPAAGSSA